MHLNFIDVDSFAEDLPEVDSPKIFESGKFAKGGLFSQQIFGPVKSYYCACPKSGYYGRNSGVSACEACGVEITSSEKRRSQFAKIRLPFEVLNPMIYYILCDIKTALKTKLFNILTYRQPYYFGESDELQPLGVDETPPEGAEILLGIGGVKRVIIKLIEKEDARPEVQFLRDNFDQITIHNVIVIPPDFRPCGKNQSGVNVSDEINQHYSFLIVRSNHMKAIPYNVLESDDVYRTNFKHIQIAVLKLYDYILGKLSKKKGLIRANILGKRIDFSGRAVISPDPTLSLDSCRVPYFMLLEILKPQLVAYLVNRRVCKRYNQASKLIDDEIKDQTTTLFDLCIDFCKDKVCVLNRQPTLHRLGVLGFRMSPHLGNTLQVHPMICSPYNADFDGDAMAIYLPVTEEATNDIKDKIGIWKNLISPTDLSLVPNPNQDIVLGIWAATKSENQETKEIKGENLPIEQALFNECLPEDYPLMKGAIDGKTLKYILNDVAFNYRPSVVMQTLDKIKNLGFALSTFKGYTLGIDDLYSQELTDIAAGLKGNLADDMPVLNSKETINKLKELPFADFIESGARGSWNQCKQLVLSRGYVSDATGIVRDNLIRNSLVQGLDQEDYCMSSWGARKGLLDTAMSTGDSGYLTRQLIYSTVNIESDENCDDCGTTGTLDLYIDSVELAKTLLWRYFLRDDYTLGRITKRNYKIFVGKTIKLRSPIYCKNPKICKKCYGDLHKILHSNQVGIIATQAVGERTTQLVLRTFHTSGVAQLSQKDGHSQQDIVSGIQLANKLFHSPETVLDQIDTPAALVKMIYNLFNPYKGIHMVHYEIIVSAMMWSKKEVWRLIENRSFVPWTWTSILTIPSKRSWLLSAAFSNLKRNLISGAIHKKTDEPTVLSDLFRL